MKWLQRKHRVIVVDELTRIVYFIKRNDDGTLEKTLNVREALKIKGSNIPAPLLVDVEQLDGIIGIGLEKL